MKTNFNDGAGAPPARRARVKAENSDAAVFALVHRLRSVKGKWGAAPEERAIEPPPPESLRRRDGDGILPIALCPRRDGFFQAEAIADARRFLDQKRS